MVKRLWVYVRKSLLLLGSVMGRKAQLPYGSHRAWLTGLSSLLILPTLACIAMSGWQEWKTIHSARILVPLRTQDWKLAGRAPSSEGLASEGLQDPVRLTTRLDEQQLARAYYTQANVLYLGEIPGRYRVFLDGDLTSWGNSSESAHSVSIPISMKRLEEGRPLDLVIELTKKMEKSSQGLITPEMADRLIQARHWKNELEPFFCATVFGVLGCLFLMGWLIQRRKQELAYFAAFAFLQALMHLCRIDFVERALGYRLATQAHTVFLLWEGSLAMLLGFSLARTRGSWMGATIGATLLASLALFVLAAASWQKYLFQIFIPLAYARGALACLIQWNVLSQRKMLATGNVASAGRREDLRRLGVGLLVIGASHALQAMFFGPSGLFRLAEFVILLSCYAAGMITESSEQMRVEWVDLNSKLREVEGIYVSTPRPSGTIRR